MMATTVLTNTIANAIMIFKVAVLNETLGSMDRDNFLVTPELAAALSPYTRRHIRRFRKYKLNIDDQLVPRMPKP